MLRSLLGLKAQVTWCGAKTDVFDLTQSVKQGSAEGPLAWFRASTPVLQALCENWHARGFSLQLRTSMSYWKECDPEALCPHEASGLLAFADNFVLVGYSHAHLSIMAGELWGCTTGTSSC